MGNLYNTYEKLKLHNNPDNNARLIYTLAAIETNFDFKYSIARGHSMNQVWLYALGKGSKGEEKILLQATQNNNGSVQLSIQGLSMIEDIENWIDYNSDVFMEYLKCF